MGSGRHRTSTSTTRPSSATATRRHSMSASELVVIVFGLFIGYWLVSKFSGGPSKPIQENSEPAPEAETEPPRPEGPEHPTQLDAQALNWSEVLQVARHADVLEIRRAYKTLMSQYHPDKVASLG